MLYRIAYSLLRFFRRFPRALPLSLLGVVAVAAASLLYAKIYQHLDNHPSRGAIAVTNGAYGENYSTPRYIEQGWSNADSLWFYNTTQGSALLPYDFFLALKQAGTQELLRSTANVDRFRYLPQDKSFFNPDALPVGFVKKTYRGKDYVGLTCAACHTGQVNFQGAALRIDGGPAMADMVGFLTALEKSLRAAQDGEAHKAFVADVLKLDNDYADEKSIDEDLRKWAGIAALYNNINHSNIDYGHARLDAFGRIYNRVVQHIINRDQLKALLGQVLVKDGNEDRRLLTPEQVDKVLEGVGGRLLLTDDEFATVMQRLQRSDAGYPGLGIKEFVRVRDRIFNVPNAPVSYPFLWDIAQSDYVQWNGLANNAGVGPLGRNTGEVIGVFAILDWGKDDSWFGLHAKWAKFSLPALVSGQEKKTEFINFKSSIDLFNLQRLESHLRSLKSPEWPFCRNAGGSYYIPTSHPGALKPSGPGYCPGKDTRFDAEKLRRGELLYNDHCVACHVVIDRGAWDRLVVGKILSVGKAGTDEAMAQNSLRTGESGNFANSTQAVSTGALVVESKAPVVQILTAATRGVVATPDAEKSFVRRGADWLYALGMSLADNNISPSMKSGNYDPDTTATPYASLLAYKGRSLNGIWATAPYLHNGSVPNLDALLMPPEKRPTSFLVGAREFDPEKVGFKTEGYEGGFRFDTAQRGNRNTGHLYCRRDKDEDKCTVFTDQQRSDLLEYLKSL